ncbi:MAG: PspC domain-containing protein [Chitinophagaceae bacterium]|nr:MAG: PspC domain-containing protein [Chitinophagaceae bacterium]
MKKVININFQGRVIPIEETSYEILKGYIESLRRYFANEEGMNEIVNDIESRIAELFSEQLKKGAVCITDEHINAIITSMGRPEDFDAETGDSNANAGRDPQYATGSTAAAGSASTGTGSSSYGSTGSGSTGTSGTGSGSYGPGNYGRTRGKFVRNEDDKIIGGVCSGLANYFGIDPVIMRILFVVLIAPLFWVYILLWIIVPSESMQTNITRRLFRNPDDKVIAGVASGLAAYFNIEIWIPRLIFALPLVLGIISGTFNALWWDWDFVPRFVTGSLGSTLFVTYIILWIAVPVATTAAEKLQMRGERVDLNSIRDTVKNDMGSFKNRAEKWGEEVKQTAENFGERAKQWGQESGTYAKRFSSEAAPLARRAGSGIGHVIGVLFKAFFLFIAAIIALSLFGVLVGVLFGGFAMFPLKNFILEGTWQNILAWSTLIFFLGVPVLSLITWLVRRIVGARSKNHYLGYVFGSLWFIGLVSAITLAGMFARNFKTRSGLEDALPINQPSSGKLMLDVAQNNVRYYNDEWFGIEWDDDMPFYGTNPDTLMLNTVRLNVVKSKDSLYHVYRVRFSRGNNPVIARNLASRINFNITQQDSLVILPKGFSITKDEKFRNQQVLVVVEVPVGKRIEIDHSVNDYNWFSVNFNRRRGFNIDWDDSWDYTYDWNTDTEYVMTESGLESTSGINRQRSVESRGRNRSGDNGAEIKVEPRDEKRYRYRQEQEPAVDTVVRPRVTSEIMIPYAAFSNLF